MQASGISIEQQYELPGKKSNKAFHEDEKEIVLTNGDAKRTDKYVGAKCGEMEYVAPLAKPNCFCIIPLSTLLCLLPLLLYWLMGTNTAQTTSTLEGLRQACPDNAKS